MRCIVIANPQMSSHRVGVRQVQYQSRLHFRHDEQLFFLPPPLGDTVEQPNSDDELRERVRRWLADFLVHLPYLESAIPHSFIFPLLSSEGSENRLGELHSPSSSLSVAINGGRWLC